jgi:hypothetical protein
MGCRQLAADASSPLGGRVRGSWNRSLRRRLPLTPTLSAMGRAGGHRRSLALADGEPIAGRRISRAGDRPTPSNAPIPKSAVSTQGVARSSPPPPPRRKRASNSSRSSSPGSGSPRIWTMRRRSLRRSMRWTPIRRSRLRSSSKFAGNLPKSFRLTLGCAAILFRHHAAPIFLRRRSGLLHIQSSAECKPLLHSLHHRNGRLHGRNRAIGSPTSARGQSNANGRATTKMCVPTRLSKIVSHTNTISSNPGPNTTIEGRSAVGEIRDLGYPFREVPRGPYHQATTAAKI